MRDGGYMQTPIVYGDILYVCRDNGVLSAFDAKTGTRHYQARLGDGKTGFSASPVAATARSTSRRRGRRLRREGRSDVRAARGQPARRSRDGDAGDLRGRAL